MSTAPPSNAESPAAPAVFVRAHQAALWHYLRALGADADTAEDVMQDTFVVALRRGLRDEGRPAVRAFLRRTARHILLRRTRDEGRRRRALIERASELWERDCADDEGRSWMTALEGCLEQLGARSRRAVLAFYFEGRQRSEIASELALRENGVKTMLQRARVALRGCVEIRMGASRP